LSQLDKNEEKNRVDAILTPQEKHFRHFQASWDEEF
jgi:hypothetical protein